MRFMFLINAMASIVICIDALCHGAQLAIPGILQISPDLKKGDFVAVYTQKSEVVALATATMDADAISEGHHGGMRLKQIA